jgi:hypothetical protein
VAGDLVAAGEIAAAEAAGVAVSAIEDNEQSTKSSRQKSIVHSETIGTFIPRKDGTSSLDSPQTNQVICPCY